MPASFPSAVKTFTTRSAGQTIDASHVNDLQDEVTAIETYVLAGSGTRVYPSTVTSLANSSAEAEILNVTVPANSWSDGDWIDLRYLTFSKANSGSTSSIIISANVGVGSSVTVFTVLTRDDVVETRWPITMRLVRLGTDVHILPPDTPGNTIPFGADLWPNLVDQGLSGGVSTPANFTAAQTITVKAKFANASVNMYINRVSSAAGTAIHYKR